MMSKPRPSMALLALLTFAPVEATPQHRAVPPPRRERIPGPVLLSPAQRTAALESIKSALRERYVFPELRPQLVKRLDEAQRSGRYDLEDPIAFAERVTDDLMDASRDRHLSLRFDPPAYAASSSGPEQGEGREAFARRRAIRDHHGLAELRLLAGNVRYLRITGFPWVPGETSAAYDEAARFLAGGDGIIVDLRGNGGGSHDAVRYLVSHFMDGNVLEMTFFHGANGPEPSRTLSEPAGRLKGRPLCVLIDDRVASAGEAFAYDVQQFKLGTLVGTRTVGAANNNDLLPIAPAFILSVSSGRPVHPVSNANWEAVGVSPDVEASSSQTLDVAHALVLARLAENAGATPEQRADYDWAKVAVEARLHPVAVTPESLKALAGSFGRAPGGSAEVEVTFRDGGLWMSRPRRPTVRLSPLTVDGLFAPEGLERLRVRISGQALELLGAGEPSRFFPRNESGVPAGTSSRPPQHHQRFLRM